MVGLYEGFTRVGILHAEGIVGLKEMDRCVCPTGQRHLFEVGDQLRIADVKAMGTTSEVDY